MFCPFVPFRMPHGICCESDVPRNGPSALLTKTENCGLEFIVKSTRIRIISVPRLDNAPR